MARCIEQGILSHTATARPFWVGDVDVTRRCLAPRAYGTSLAGQMTLGQALRQAFARVTGR
jgi:hypothetical protein